MKVQNLSIGFLKNNHGKIKFVINQILKFLSNPSEFIAI